MGPFPPAANEPPARSLLDRSPPRWLLGLLLCLALLVRGGVMLLLAGSLDADPDSYRELASHLCHDHTFGVWRPQFERLTPTASRPPLYPLVLAIVECLNPSATAPAPIVGVLHLVFGVASVWAVWRLGQAWGLPPGGSLLAAGLTAVDPILLVQSTQVMTETLATLLALLTLLALTHSARRGSFFGSIVCGAMLGLCVLCRPTFLVWLVAIAALMLPFRTSGRRRFARFGALVGVAAVVLAPWAIRNQIVFGRGLMTTTHGGFTLLLANNPQFYDYLRTAPRGSAWDGQHVYRWWSSSQVLIDTPGGVVLDELDADRRAYELAWENIRSEPATFAYSCLVRVGRLWGILPHETGSDESTTRRLSRYAVAMWYTVELLFAAAGICTLGRKLFRRPWVWGVLLLLSFTLVHALYWSDLRMRAPLMGVVALLAAQGVVVLAARFRAATPLGVET